MKLTVFVPHEIDVPDKQLLMLAATIRRNTNRAEFSTEELLYTARRLGHIELPDRWHENADESFGCWTDQHLLAAMKAPSVADYLDSVGPAPQLDPSSPEAFIKEGEDRAKGAICDEPEH